MKVLVACEYSGRVRRAFRTRGHDAWSCDLLPSEDASPHHLIGDVRPVLRQQWDLVIAHPPCTYLCRSGARWWSERAREQQAAIGFFVRFTTLRCAWAIENPIGLMSKLFRKPDQIIQPWWFGHGETKATCLWLHRLPPLSLRPRSSTDGTPSAITCRPVPIAGRSAAAPTKASPTRWPSNGAQLR